MPEHAPYFRKVLVVANARIPGERAQSIQTVRTAAAFARAGCEVDLLHADRRVRRAIEGIAPGADPLAYYGVREPVRLRPVPVLDWIERVPTRLQYLPARIEELTFGWNAARLAMRERGALVHCREIETGALLARARHPRYLFEAHSIPGSRTKRRWLERSMRRALCVVAITEGLALDLASVVRFAREEIFVVPDAFDPTAFADVPGREEARRRLGLGDGFVAVYTGHLFPWKGAGTLVAAARLAPEVRFRLVGGLPEDVGRVRREAAGLANVEVLGHRPPTEVPLHLAAADVVLVPNSAGSAISERHTSPLKLFEAMAAGRAIVASDLQSLREVLSHDRDALLVAPDDPAALAGAIRALAADAPRRERLAAKARAESARSTFDARAQRLLDLATTRARARGL